MFRGKLEDSFTRWEGKYGTAFEHVSRREWNNTNRLLRETYPYPVFAVFTSGEGKEGKSRRDNLPLRPRRKSWRLSENFTPPRKTKTRETLDGFLRDPTQDRSNHRYLCLRMLKTGTTR